jgi:transposase
VIRINNLSAYRPRCCPAPAGRNFSAWIGLVPKQRSSGGKDRLGSIGKHGEGIRGRRPLLFARLVITTIQIVKVANAWHAGGINEIVAELRRARVTHLSFVDRFPFGI